MIWLIMKILKNIFQIKNEILIVFDDMIADMLSNKNFNPAVTELFIRLKIFHVFITQSNFTVLKILD